MPDATATDDHAPQAEIAATAPHEPIGMRREEGEPAGLERTPGVLRHLQRMTGAFTHNRGKVPFVYIYSRMDGQPQDAVPTADLAPPLRFFVADDSGIEGIACVDDVARAVVLAMQVYEQTASPRALALGQGWLEFLRYMQLPDNRIVNFIKDPAGTRNVNGQTSYPGGLPWTVRALTAFATTHRVTQDRDCLARFQRTQFPTTTQMPLNAVYMLALMDLYETRPDYGYERWITDLGAELMAAGPDYLRNRCGQEQVELFDYHQVQALARAGRILSNKDYIAFAESTVDHLVRPVVDGGFYHVWPGDRDHQSVFDVSAIALGLEELFYVTQKGRYKDLALRCVDWLSGNNPAGKAVYDPRTGRCHDNINLKGEVAPTTGAESAIEAGFLHLVRCRLTDTREGLEEAPDEETVATISL
jgi:hypothetical protein